MQADVSERLERLLAAARQIADPNLPFGRQARARLVASSELSSEGVELALTRSLECAPSPQELELLAKSVVPATRAHVILSATVFTAAHRAIATALAASPVVAVRPSRRDPVFSELLHRADPGLFSLVSRVDALPGDHVFAYGTTETLGEIRRTLPSGVVLHAHGPGFGVVVTDARAPCDVDLLALDVAAFDQRGCLSPRAVLIEGDDAAAIALAERLARALTEVELRIPLGRLSAEESAEIVRYRDSLSYAGFLAPAGRGFVGIAPRNAPFRIAPVGRNLHVIATADADALVRAYSSTITTFAVSGTEPLHARIRAALPRAREAVVGRMQAPAFDGPVDLRSDGLGEVV